MREGGSTCWEVTALRAAGGGGAEVVVAGGAKVGFVSASAEGVAGEVSEGDEEGGECEGPEGGGELDRAAVGRRSEDLFEECTYGTRRFLLRACRPDGQLRLVRCQSRLPAVGQKVEVDIPCPGGSGGFMMKAIL